MSPFLLQVSKQVFPDCDSLSVLSLSVCETRILRIRIDPRIWYLSFIRKTVHPLDATSFRLLTSPRLSLLLSSQRIRHFPFHSTFVSSVSSLSIQTRLSKSPFSSIFPPPSHYFY